VATDREAGRRLEAAGSGPLVVWLATEGSGDVEELDPRLSNGVIIRLLRGEAGT
jgi:hypothetical protein